MLKLNSKKLTIIISACSILSAAAASAQGQTPAAAEPNLRLPGHITTTTVKSGAEEAAPVPAPHKPHKGYASIGFLSATTSTLEGYTILDYKGLVEGAAVRVPTWNEDASAGVQERQGGKIDSYTQLCEEARVEAFSTMVERAKELGANALVGIHFDSQVMPLDQGRFASGVVCVGTAVNVQKR